MSSYLRKTKHPQTGKWETAAWLDDYFGRHQYGVKFLDEQVFNAKLYELPTTEENVDVDWAKFFPQDAKEDTAALPPQPRLRSPTSSDAHPMNDYKAKIEEQAEVLTAFGDHWQCSDGCMEKHEILKATASLLQLVTEAKKAHYDFAKRVQLEADANICDCGRAWVDTDLKDLADQEVAKLKNHE